MSDNQAKEHFTCQQNQIGQIIISLIIRYLSATRKPDSLCPTSAEGASCFCQTMPPSGRQLMSIGASEHRAFVRAKARFAGQRLRNTVLSVEMLLHRTYCRVSLVAFSGGKCRACLALPDVPASDLPVLIHSRWKTPPARPSAASVAARCEPILAFPLLPGPSTHPAWLFAASAAARCEPFSLNRLIPAPCYSGSWPGTMAAGAGNRLPPAMLLC